LASIPLALLSLGKSWVQCEIPLSVSSRWTPKYFIELVGEILVPLSFIFKVDGGGDDSGFLKKISSVFATFNDILLLNIG
jgi:hypothetical protein